MLVTTGEIIVRDETPYEVVIADDNIFVIGAIQYNKKENSFTTSYENLEAYSNDESVNTLDELHFVKKA